MGFTIRPIDADVGSREPFFCCFLFKVAIKTLKDKCSNLKALMRLPEVKVR